MSMLALQELGIVRYVEELRRVPSVWGFLHVPKTAGTSLVSEIAHCGRPSCRISQRNLSASDQAKLDDEWAAVLEFARQQKSLPEGSKHGSWSGHLRHAHVQYLKAEFPGTRCFTMLREPASRVISAYRYLLTVHPDRELMAERYPSVWDYASDAKFSQNIMVRRLAPGWFDGIEGTVRAILRTYDFIGTVELYSMSGSIILGMMNSVHKPSLHLNKGAEGKSERFAANPELIERIRAVNAADVVLFRRVTEILGSQQHRWWDYFDQLKGTTSETSHESTLI
jgi:Sulfotransferase family